eukprot:scaffold2077_cov119-Cylindrotheca_fusiformis.AAC.6
MCASLCIHRMLARLFRYLLILETVSTLTTAWIFVPSTSKLGSSSSQLRCVVDSAHLCGRRSFLLSSVGFTVGASTLASTATAKDVDPFATLDAMAEKIGNRNSNDPSSISRLPTRNETEKERLTGDEHFKDSSPMDMDEALRKTRKQKRIDPRTHG